MVAMLITPPSSPIWQEEMGNVPSCDAISSDMEAYPLQPISLQPRFGELKQKIASQHSKALGASWDRLSQALAKDVETVRSNGSNIIPDIDFDNVENPAYVESFSRRLRKRGIAIIRNVVPPDLALKWQRETLDYLIANPQTQNHPSDQPEMYDMFWSPSQIKARLHPNILAAQKFAMSHWKTSSDPSATITHTFPVSYADRVRIRWSGSSSAPSRPRIDGGSVERWEQDGYGLAGTYAKIFSGEWEKHDPWDATTREGATSDLYNSVGQSSIFRMFQGWLALSDVPASGGFMACPMLQTATAYFLLRPFFSPRRGPESGADAYLAAENWALDDPQTSVLHGALPSYAQQLSDELHPHLQLASSMIAVPALNPGDYLIWHPDLAHATAAADWRARGSIAMCVPACPLSPTSALYLCRQRKAFLLGRPGPDWGSGRGESEHVGRPGVQEISDAGGEEGLRAMGLLPWDEELADTDAERKVLALANGILFPDQYDML